MISLPKNIPLEFHFVPAINKGATIGDKLMIVLHGRGDTLHSYKVFSKEVNITGLNYLLLNAPFNEMFGHSWYDDAYDFKDKKYTSSLQKLSELIKLLQSHGIPSHNIFLFGFSQGGRMVMDLFHLLDQAFAGVVALSPRVSQFNHLKLSKESSQTPIFVAHGKYDPIISVAESQNNLEVWKRQVTDFQFHLYDMGHEIDVMEIITLRNWLNEKI